jgi:uncharacterized protein YkuJ
MSFEQNTNTMALTITFTDSDLRPEELDQEAVQLLTELSDRRDIEAVDRVRDLNPPDGNKSIGGFLVGMMTAKVSVANAKKVLSFLGDRLGNKPIAFEAEINGTKMKVSAYSKEEAAFAMQQIEAFIEKHKS